MAGNFKKKISQTVREQLIDQVVFQKCGLANGVSEAGIASALSSELSLAQVQASLVRLKAAGRIEEL